MLTKLSKQVVYNCIKNFFYNPVYKVDKVQIMSTDLSGVLFQFDPTICYCLGAYVVKAGQLYLTIRAGSGPWASESIANTFTGEVYTGEQYLADVETGDYDSSRFIPISVIGAITVYEVSVNRTNEFKMAFNNYRNAMIYIRSIISDYDYNIRIVQQDNEYTAYWDDRTMDFYEPEN